MIIIWVGSPKKESLFMPREKLGDMKRSVMVGVKVTPEFRKYLETCAQKEGLTLSTFIVNVLKIYFMRASDV